MNRYSIRMYWRQRREAFAQWVAGLLPRRVLYYATLRATGIYTSSPEFGNGEVPAALALDVARGLMTKTLPGRVPT